MQNYKIFIQNTAFYISSDQEFLSSKSIVVKEEDIKFSISSLKALSKDVNSVGVYSLETEKCFEKVLTCFDMVKAAGGMVFNDENEVLWINRLGKWDLPKGKIEEGESIEEAAIREVEEETGITDLIIEKKLCSTFHTYDIYGDENVKETYWFLMRTSFMGEGVPQEEEDITEVKWMGKKEMNDVAMINTYESIRDVINSL